MTPAYLNVDVENAVVSASLRGEVDLSNAAELRDDLTSMIPNAALGLILDLSELGYLDSAGIHMLHHLREEVRARGQRLRLVLPPDSIVRDTLRLAGLDWEDDTVESIQEARQAFEP